MDLHINQTADYTRDKGQGTRDKGQLNSLGGFNSDYDDKSVISLIPTQLNDETVKLLNDSRAARSLFLASGIDETVKNLLDP